MAICATPGCPIVVTRGHCRQHARQRDLRRGTAHRRGYDARWARLVKTFVGLLVQAGVAPVCGATLPGVPATGDSLCAAEGLQVFESLDCDHIQPHEGQSDPRFWDVTNLQFLCHARCHPRKTATKDGGFGRDQGGDIKNPKFRSEKTAAEVEKGRYGSGDLYGG